MNRCDIARTMRGQLMRVLALSIALICAIALPVNAEQALPTATSRTLPDVRPDIDLSGDANSSTDTLQPAEATGQHRVYASLPPVFALVEQMLRGIEEFTPLQLVQPQLDCVRLYDMSDWDYIQLSNAEICVIWGEGLESFAGTLTSAESGPAVITLADAPREFAALNDELTDYDYYEHYSGENPNSHLSMERLSAALDALKESLCELYPAYAERFELNYVEARRLMDEALGELAALRESAPDALCAALYEGAPYALDELGMNWTIVYPREPASEVTGADLDEWLSQLSESGAQIVVLERQAPAELVDTLRAQGYDVRLISTLMTLNEPTLDELLSAMLTNARALCGVS